MKLTVWTYEGPPHVGAMRVATAMQGVHYVLHAPQGDTYADLLFTMIERRDRRPPVTYTTFEARDLGTDTADLFKRAARDAYERFMPQAMLVGASCTAELLQDDPGGLSKTLGLGCPAVPLELPSYSRKENWGASETFYALVKTFATPVERRDDGPSCNILGPVALGFRHRDDVKEIAQLLRLAGVRVNVIAPLNATPEDLSRLGEADFNVVLYPEIAENAARYLEKTCYQRWTKTIPYGVSGTRAFLNEIGEITGLTTPSTVEDEGSRMPWWSRSIDSTYLTAKRVFVFGEGNRAVSAAQVAAEELGFEVVGIGCYNREYARPVREAAKKYGVEPLITEDYLEVEAAIAAANPELVLGTQMERHIAKRLRVPCAVISAPFHVQDHPARSAPQLGFEGANNLFDAWVHPLVMGLEEHLLGMFRDDPEFNDAAGPSHLHGGSGPVAEIAAQAGAETSAEARLAWDESGERELKKIPFFVRGKARRNTEAYAAERGIALITVDTLYEAKAHYAR